MPVPGDACRMDAIIELELTKIDQHTEEKIAI
jgi:hypothetical protein